MKNFVKAEMVIEIDDAELLMVGSFECLMNIEKKIKRNLLKVIINLDGVGMSISELRVMFEEALKAGGNSFSKKEIEQMIQKKGVMNVMKIIVDFLKISFGIKE